MSRPRLGPGATDADVPAWWAGLGLPGLQDVHVHFLPPPVLRKVREQFDSAGPLIGREWPLVYRGDDEERVARLRALGVRRFSTLPYAHRPGIAEYLNGWAWEFSDAVPEALRSCTLYPEDGVADYVAARVADRAEIVKVHVQVGAFDVRDRLLREAWGLLEDAGLPVVLHAGSGPVATPFTGPGPVAGLLRDFPRLALVIAHAGAPEYEEFLVLAETYERVRLDTTMAFTDFFTEMGGAFPDALLPRLRDLGLGGAVLLGTDFPSIPYAYAHQLEALERLDLGDDWLRSVCWHNADQLLG